MKRPLIIMETKLKDIPEAWLRYVEPRIKREGMCWLWQGATNDRGEPVIAYYNLKSHRRNTRLVKWIIAELFWVMKRGMEVIHHCGTTICLNPSHFYISSKHHTQEDREKMQKRKRILLDDYIRRLTPKA